MLFEQQINTAGFTPAVDVNVGKWLSPQFAVRLGVQGASMTEYVRDNRGVLTPTRTVWAKEDRYKLENKYFYVHTDFMWNLNNTFGISFLITSSASSRATCPQGRPTSRSMQWGMV